MRIKIAILAIIILSIFLLGQEGCPTTQQKTGKSGMDFSLQTGPGFLSSGVRVEQGEGFYVEIDIKNYDEEKRTGRVCVRDNVADSYMGIDEDCEAFTIEAAESVDKKLDEGEKTIFFPKSGEYYYENLPIEQRANLYVDFFYRQIQKVTGQVGVPSGEISLDRESAPISVSVETSVHRVKDTGEYKINLNTYLKKTSGEIFLPDFSDEEKIIFSASLGTLDLDCRESGIIEFKNEKLIKCSALVSLGQEQQVSYPLIINLDYGVNLLRQYSFIIEEEE